MRAMIIEQAGSSEVLQLRHLDKPEPKAGEVRVRIAAAGLNPIDTKVRKRGLMVDEGYPAVLGCDGAGIIDALGEGVAQYAIGDAVYYCYGGLGQKHAGSYAEYACLPAYCLAHKPVSASFTEAAALPLALITAWESLFDRAALNSDDYLLIHGGMGGVAHIAVQLAKLANAHIAVTVRSPEKADLLRDLGVERCIHPEHLDKELQDWTQGKGLHVFLDTVGDGLIKSVIPHMRCYGDIVSLLALPEQLDWQTLRLRNIRITQELMLSPMLLKLPEEIARQAALLEQAAQWFDTDQLKVHIEKRWPLNEVAQAHQQLEQGHACGKHVLYLAAV